MEIRSFVLCADAISLQHPEALGLEGEALGRQGWLRIVSDADEARGYARSAPQGLEVWVAGSDQMEGINLAAAIKHDRADANVSLVSFSGGGSLLSRAKAAGLDGVLDRRGFLERYLAGKRSASCPGGAVAGSPGLSGHVGGPCPAEPFQVGASAVPDPLAKGPAQAGAPQVARPPAGFAASPRDFRGYAVPGGEPRSAGTWPAPAAVGAPSSKGYVLTVVGAGGGTGKSTVAALCACCAKESGRKTAIVDADLQFGDIAFLLGCSNPLHVDDLAEAPLRIEGADGEGRLPVVVAAPKRLERSEVAAAGFPQVLDLLRKRFDVVVVNTGPTWGELQMQLMEASNGVLFLVDQRPSSIRACRHVLDLCARCGIASQPFLFAVNRCSRKALFSSIDVSCALQGVHVHELADGGKAVEELLGTGQPFDLIDSGNPLSSSVADMMADLLPGSSGKSRDLAVPRRRKAFSKKGRAVR